MREQVDARGEQGDVRREAKKVALLLGGFGILRVANAALDSLKGKPIEPGYASIALVFSASLALYAFAKNRKDIGGVCLMIGFCVDQVIRSHLQENWDRAVQTAADMLDSDPIGLVLP